MKSFFFFNSVTSPLDKPETVTFFGWLYISTHSAKSTRQQDDQICGPTLRVEHYNGRNLADVVCLNHIPVTMNEAQVLVNFIHHFIKILHTCSNY